MLAGGASACRGERDELRLRHEQAACVVWRRRGARGTACRGVRRRQRGDLDVLPADVTIMSRLPVRRTGRSVVIGGKGPTEIAIRSIELGGRN